MKTKKIKQHLFCAMLFGLLFFGVSAVAQISGQLTSGQLTLNGQVKNHSGETIVGASVRVKGTPIGTSTDVDGRYTLSKVPTDAVLEISFVSMKTLEVPVGNRTEINVSMEDDATTLDQAVVIGYGSVRKSDVTGAVTSVKTGDIKQIPANSVDGLLQGRAAGLQVVSNSQAPGAGATIRIRGGSSLRGSNAPLVVVDGFPLGDAGDLKQINPADIVSMDLLKDASSAAIYGSRGANGVIIITTRRAKTGTTSVSVSQQSTVSQFDSKLNLWRDPVLMATLNNEGRINGGYNPLYIGEYSSTGIYYPSIEELKTTWGTNTRWDELVFRNAPVSNNTTATVSSSNEKTNFNLSANFFTDKGMYIQDDYKKGSYNLNVEHTLYKNLKIRVANILARGIRNNNGGLAYWRNPIFPVYNDDGSFFMFSNQDFSHPIAITEKSLNKTKSLDMISSGMLEWQVIPELKLTSQLNYKYGASINDSYSPKRYTEAGEFNNGLGSISNNEWQTLVSENYANYQKTFNEKHNVSVMAGYSSEYSLYRSSLLRAMDFANESLRNENLSTGNPAKNELANGYSRSVMQSFMFRANYVFNDKYLATFTARADGSSKFGVNNKWALFPSGALSWKAHDESFIKDLHILNELKPRISYGISGNQGISPYQTLSRYGVGKYFNDGNWSTAIGPGYVSGWADIFRLWSGIPNPDLRWETTAQTNIGLDIGMLDNRLRFTFDYYDKQTRDLLRKRNLAPSSGYSKMWVNDGKIQNRGFELTIDGSILDKNDWRVNGTLIFARNRNKITDLGESLTSGLVTDPNTGMQYEYAGNSLEQFRAYPNILAIGQPINMFYGYKTDGIIQTLEEGLAAGLVGAEAQPGEFKYIDLNGDGEINEKDRTLIGNPNPKFLTSLILNVSYKGFDASVFFNGVFGQDILNTQAFNQPSNQPLRWTSDNPTNDYPSLRDGRQVKLSDWWIHKGSFVRVQNVAIGYTFRMPQNFVLAKARIYANAANLYTFTNFKGYDPEVDLSGIYYGGYPRLRKITLGLDLTF